MADNDFETLEPKKSLALWRQGKDAWNAWVEKNPEYNIDFSGVDFSEHGKKLYVVSFSGFQFPVGNVSFEYTNFGKERAYFSETKFNKGYISFIYAQFGEGGAYFDGVEFGEGNVHFTCARFNGPVDFTDLKRVWVIEMFSFRGAIFDGTLNISSDGKFSCLIDLTQTKKAHHVSLDGLKLTLLREKNRISRFFPEGDWATQNVLIYSNDIACARRLKELAEGNKDHEAAQNFHVLEMQAKRVHSKCPIGYLWNTEFWYEKLSDYGRSITRPLLWMAYIWWVWTIAYMTVSFMETDKAQFVKSAVYSFAQMFAFIPSSRDARFHLGEALFKKTPPDLIYALTFSQSILALMLLFLLGLGLRHRYRI